MRVRIVTHVTSKILYIMANLVSFLVINATLNGGFYSYGLAWVNWSKLENQFMYDYIRDNALPRPGESLLPTFGMCDVLLSSLDNRHLTRNPIQVICEYKTHVLYHYVLMLLWFAIVFGIVISVIGCLQHMIYLLSLGCTNCSLDMGAKKLMEALALREKEYLHRIRRKKPDLFEQVVNKLMMMKLNKFVGRDVASDCPLETPTMCPGLRKRAVNQHMLNEDMNLLG